MTNEAPDSGLAGTISGYQADRPTVLVASGDATVLMYTTVMLKDSGRFNVLLADSGEHAMQQAKGFAHDIT